MKKIICVIFMTFMLLISGCVEKSTQEAQGNNYRDSIVYNLGKMPKDLIMLDSNDIREKDLLVNSFEGLVKSDEKGNIVPALSEKWEISKDETSYTFKIRENAKWSDGSDITAEDFVKFFSDILNKEINNIYSDQLSCIFGAEKYRNGEDDFKNVAIAALDKKSLQIRLNYPCSYFLNILSEPIYGLRKIDDNLTKWSKEYKNILYSGSFTIDKISNSKEVTLKKNENYWDKDSVKSDKVLVTFINSSEGALAAFQNYKINLFVNPPLSEVKNVINSGKYFEIPSYNGEAIVFNLKKEGIVNNENFRKAVSFSIDRNDIVQNILNNTAKIAEGYVPNNVSDGLNGKFINKVFFTKTAEKDKAYELMKKVEYNKKERPLKLIYIDTVENKKICEGIAKNINDLIGVKIECSGYGIEEFKEELKKNDYDMAKITYKGSYDYPLSFIEKWNTISKDNLYGYKNNELDNKLMKVKFEKNNGKKVEILRESENILMQDMPIVPLYFNNTIICEKSYVEGVYNTKKGNIKLDKAYLSPQQ